MKECSESVQNQQQILDGQNQLDIGMEHKIQAIVRSSVFIHLEHNIKKGLHWRSGKVSLTAVKTQDSADAEKYCRQL